MVCRSYRRWRRTVQITLKRKPAEIRWATVSAVTTRAPAAIWINRFWNQPQDAAGESAADHVAITELERSPKQTHSKVQTAIEFVNIVRLKNIVDPLDVCRWIAVHRRDGKEQRLPRRYELQNLIQCNMLYETRYNLENVPNNFLSGSMLDHLEYYLNLYKKKWSWFDLCKITKFNWFLHRIYNAYEADPPEYGSESKSRWGPSFEARIYCDI